VVKRVLESGKVVPGGGCVETAVSVRLENFAVQASACAIRHIAPSPVLRALSMSGRISNDRHS
jgi:chaperonin GroEL (HSP60 family)